MVAGMLRNIQHSVVG